MYRTGKELPERKEIEISQITLPISNIKRKNYNDNDDFIYVDIGSINNLKNKIVSYKIFKWKNAPSRAQQIIKLNGILFSTVRTYLKTLQLLKKNF
ncbi:MAG TPA: hypothetical protein PLP99_04965 [Ignavibacteriales bacterium]|nr:hypothetical protein [Ignavibacteriales bacterium]HOL81095.1 hypothetical protein [Ignavibacteriales bacterium]HPP34460.1 hypothetical protein [Ignavibacteriales bacterium]